MSENTFVLIFSILTCILIILSLIAVFKDSPYRTERTDSLIRGAGATFLAGFFLFMVSALTGLLEWFSGIPGLLFLATCFVVPAIIIFYVNGREVRKRRKLIQEKCATLNIDVPSGDLLEVERRVEHEEKEYKKREEVREYLLWCDNQTDEERVLQFAVDRLLQIHNWNGMPRVKACWGTCGPNASGRYHGSFDGFRKPFRQHIEVDKRHQMNTLDKLLIGILKHELVHAWVDWKGIYMSDPHGPEFQAKLQEVS